MLPYWCVAKTALDNMKEHPIPQDITGYRFHIVGSMTLKQFGEMGAGVLLAGLVYTTNLVSFIKFPLMFILFGMGVVAAFLPIGERPLSHWLTTFFRILYKPTQFFWKRTENIPEVFLYKARKDVRITYKELDLSPARRQRIKEFLSSSHESEYDETDFTIEEQQQMKGILSMFGNQIPPEAVARKTTVPKPILKVRVREMRPTPSSSVDLENALSDNIDLSQPNKDKAGVELFQLSKDVPQQEASADDAKKTFVQTSEVADRIVVPESKAVRVEASTKEELAEAAKPKESKEGDRAFVKAKSQVKEDEVKAEQGQFNASLPFPNKPSEPNKLVGMVLTPNNELIPGAVVEIRVKNSNDIARAVKTNALGQFFITTPLKKGEYVVDVEKEGYSFTPFSIKLKDKIVDPIEVRSE